MTPQSTPVTPLAWTCGAGSDLMISPELGFVVPVNELDRTRSYGVALTGQSGLVIRVLLQGHVDRVPLRSVDTFTQYPISGDFEDLTSCTSAMIPSSRNPAPSRYDGAL